MKMKDLFILIFSGFVMLSFLIGCVENKKLAENVTPPKAEKSRRN